MFSFSYCVWYLAGTYHTWTNRWLKNKCPHVSHVSSLLVRWFPNAPIFDMLLVNHWTTSRYPWVNRLLRAVVDAECCSVLVWCSIPEYCSIPAIGAHICIIYIVQYSIYIYTSYPIFNSNKSCDDDPISPLVSRSQLQWFAAGEVQGKLFPSVPGLPGERVVAL